MKKSPSFPAGIRNFLLAFLICYFLISLGYEKLKEFSKTRSEIREARKIVERAQQIVVYLPNKDLRNFVILGLNSLIITKVPNTTAALLALKKKFILNITDNLSVDNGLNPTNTALLGCVGDEFVIKNNVIEIGMDTTFFHCSDDMDAKAVGLIHEFVHGFQIERNMKTSIHQSSFQREIEAWEYQTNLYLALHPNLQGIECVCGIRIGISDEVTDRLVQDMVAFNKCKEKFLEKFYDSKK